MDTQTFLAEFSHIARAPGGTARLRMMIRQLAVQGRLVPQLRDEEPASAFLARAAATLQSARSRRTSVGRLDSDLGAELLPVGWSLVDLATLAHPQAGFAFKSAHFNELQKGKPIVRVRDVGVNMPRTYYSGKYREEFTVEPGSWLVAMDGDFRIAQWEGPRALLNQRVTQLQFYSVEINQAYICMALQFELRRLQGTKNYTTVDHLSGKQIGAARIRLPPLKEQARIVVKVDELIALCDQLEGQQLRRRKLQDSMRQSAIRAASVASNSLELQAASNSLTANFKHLFGLPGDVRQLRDLIYYLGLQGALLRGVRAPSARRTVSEERAPLPPGWQWNTLTNVTRQITSGSRSWKGFMSNSGDTFVRSQDIRQDALILENPAYVSLPEKVEGKRTLICENDLLLTITGGNVGRCAVAPKFPHDAFVSQHVALIRLCDPRLSDFIHLWVINPFGGRGFLARYIYGDKPGLNLKQVGSIPIPIPPETVLPLVIEQLSAFQRFCDGLTSCLSKQQAMGAALAVAATSALAGIIINQPEEKTVKVPQTELMAPLRLGQLPGIGTQAPLAVLLARHDGEMLARDLWQRFGGEIDAFYAQLKTEVFHGWIAEPEVAKMREIPESAAVA